MWLQELILSKLRSRSLGNETLEGDKNKKFAIASRDVCLCGQASCPLSDEDEEMSFILAYICVSNF